MSEVVQLATRIPKELHERLKVFCVESDTSIMDFVTEALEEALFGPGVQRGRPTPAPASVQPRRVASRASTAARRITASSERSSRKGRSLVDWRRRFGHITATPRPVANCPVCGQAAVLGAYLDAEQTCDHDVGWLVEKEG